MGCKAWFNDKYREREVISKDGTGKERVLRCRLTEVYNGNICSGHSYTAVLWS